MRIIVELDPNTGQANVRQEPTEPTVAPETTTDNRLLLTPEHAADKLDVGRTTIYALMKTGELRSVKIGHSRRIPADALDEYVGRLANG